MRLAGKVAFITGGSSGIGLAAAKLFTAEGAKVAIVGRDADKLADAATQIGTPTLAISADAADPAALQRAMARTAERVGGLDIVFANAGSGGLTPLGDTGFEAFESIIRNNLTSAFFTVQAALPHLRDGGSVILNGSVHATLGVPGWAAYAAAKGGVRTMTRNLAAELAPRRIRVNQVTPGATRTPIWSFAAPTAQAMDELDARIGKSVPLGRMGEPEEIAKAVLFLASEESVYVTGTELVVDGAATSAPSGAPVYRAAA
jgi:NAD(P)-dependent dehydrogenase (short-subunit alcohol dehydrogenase family)